MSNQAMEANQLLKLKKIILVLFLIIGISHSGFAATEKNTSLNKKPTATASVKKPAHPTAKTNKKKHKLKRKKHKLKNTHHMAQIRTPHNEDEANAADSDSQDQNSNPNFVTSLKQHLVNFVKNSVSNLRYSAYKMGGNHFDAERGIYVVDCSGYVDYTLRAVYPDAYSSLVNSSGTDKPNSLHYYDFFSGLTNDPSEHWNKVESVEKLQPGDILVFRYKNSSRSGHVMVVMNKPVLEGDSYWVSVADSAPVGHSQDTRLPNTSGVGIGVLLLKTNTIGQPAAFAWKIGSRWERNVRFAMARPTSDYQTN